MVTTDEHLIQIFIHSEIYHEFYTLVETHLTWVCILCISGYKYLHLGVKLHKAFAHFRY
jgi:hypothetical protein